MTQYPLWTDDLQAQAETFEPIATSKESSSDSTRTGRNEADQPPSPATGKSRISIYDVNRSFPRELQIDGRFHYRFYAANQFARGYSPATETDVGYFSTKGYSLELDEVSYLKPSIDRLPDSHPPGRLKVKRVGSRGKGVEFVKRFNGFYTPTQMRPRQVERFFDLIASEYDSLISVDLNASVFLHLLRTARRLLLRQANATTIKVLDYGIGTGLASQQVVAMPDIQLTGVDISGEMIKLCRQRGLEAKRCTYDVIPVHTGQVDIAICCFVAQYLFDETPFRELRRVLRNGGVLALNLHKASQAEEINLRQLLTAVGFEEVSASRVPFRTDGQEREITIMTGLR